MKIMLFDNFSRTAVTVAVLFATGSSLSCSADTDDICSGRFVVTESLIACNTGDIKTALCSSSSVGYRFVGHRACNAAGNGWSEAICPDGFDGFGQFTDYLIVTRKAIAAMPDFDNLYWALLGTHNIEVMTVEDMTTEFPSPSIAESIRLGLAYVMFTETMGRLKYVLFVGQPDLYSFNDGLNLNRVAGDVDIPFFYVSTPATWGDDPYDNAIASLMPYGYLRGVWPKSAGETYWTPELFQPDVHVGFLPAYGRISAADSSGKPETDLQAYADKRNAWTAPATIRMSQFYSGDCPAINDPIDAVMDNSDVGEDIGKVAVHTCKNGETGDMGKFATADGSSYLFYAYHGDATGSCIAGAYCYDAYSVFGGIVFGHSCETATPDFSSPSLAESQLTSLTGAIAYIGQTREAAIQDYGDPMKRAPVAGRWTVGDAVDGYRTDIARDLTTKMWVRDLLSLVLFGDPALPIAAAPAVIVQTVAAHVNDDGSVNACVQVTSEKGAHEIAIGNSNIMSYDGGNGWVTLAVPGTSSGMTTGSLLHLTDCDPSKVICQASQVLPEPILRINCGAPIPNADGTADVIVTAPYGIDGSGLNAAVTAIDLICETGITSSCFTDAVGTQQERQLASIDLPRLEAGANRLTFQPQPTTGQDAYFRALRVRFTGTGGFTVAECYVPMDATTATNLHLL
jgi:hypothetical protein